MAEEQTGVAEARAAAAAMLEDAGFVALDLAAGTLAFDDRAARLFGRAELAQSDQPLELWRRLPISGLKALIHAVRAVHAGERDRATCAILVREPDPQRRHLRIALQPVGEERSRLFAAISDVTEQRRAEANMLAALKTAPSAMIVIDERGRIQAFSAAAERIFGYPAADMIGRLINILMPEPHRSSHADYLLRYLSTGEARIVGRSRQLQAMRADGSLFPAEVWVGEARIDGERLFTGFLRDQTPRFEVEAKLQELQNDLVHASRLSAMGELSLALAHELNQPLAALVNHLDIAAHHASALPGDDGEKLRRTLSKGSRQALRAGEIVKRLRTFVARGEAEPGPERADHIVGDAVSLLSSLAQRRGIQLRISLPGSSARVFADRVQLQQVLINLMRNAIEALEGREQPLLCVSVENRDGGLEFMVEDNGPGVAVEDEDRLFSRFLTSKGEAGMGVGLSISRRIVEAHGSVLRYRRSDSGGARFSFTLPKLNEDSHGRH